MFRRLGENVSFLTPGELEVPIQWEVESRRVSAFPTGRREAVIPGYPEDSSGHP